LPDIITGEKLQRDSVGIPVQRVHRSGNADIVNEQYRIET